MNGVALQFVVLAECLALRYIRARIDLENIPPCTVRLDAGGVAPLLAPSRKPLKKILDRQLRHGAEIVVTNVARGLPHIAPQRIDIGLKGIAAPFFKLLQQDAAPIVAVALDGVTE